MKKAIFLDRDGVINKVCYHYEQGIYSAKNLTEFELIEGVKEAIQKLKKMGFLIIVITNQPGFAFGYLKEEEVDKINEFMIQELDVDKIYTCKHHPHWTGDCNCRKPKSGLLVQAADELGIDIKNSYMVGDNISDLLAGKDCLKRIFIGQKRCDICKLFVEKGVSPDAIVLDLSEAALEIEKLENN
jgi:D-glycero-D-manno-heptose 1,7-bisphosphate phosphatase